MSSGIFKLFSYVRRAVWLIYYFPPCIIITSIDPIDFRPVGFCIWKRNFRSSKPICRQRTESAVFFFALPPIADTVYRRPSIYYYYWNYIIRSETVFTYRRAKNKYSTSSALFRGLIPYGVVRDVETRMTKSYVRMYTDRSV